jgi:hypothetical protein
MVARQLEREGSVAGTSGDQRLIEGTQGEGGATTVPAHPGPILVGLLKLEPCVGGGQLLAPLERSWSR